MICNTSWAHIVAFGRVGGKHRPALACNVNNVNEASESVHRYIVFVRETKYRLSKFVEPKLLLVFVHLNFQSCSQAHDQEARTRNADLMRWLWRIN